MTTKGKSGHQLLVEKIQEMAAEVREAGGSPRYAVMNPHDRRMLVEGFVKVHKPLVVMDERTGRLKIVDNWEYNKGGQVTDTLATDYGDIAVVSDPRVPVGTIYVVQEVPKFDPQWWEEEK